MNTVTTRRAGRREWIGLAVIALPCLLYSMDLTVLFPAVPHLSADLRPSSVQLLWITDIYGFLLAGSLITMGTLGDRIGRRQLLLIGAGAFGAASVLAAYAPTPELLIAARALLGVAGATLAPSTLSLAAVLLVIWGSSSSPRTAPACRRRCRSWPAWPPGLSPLEVGLWMLPASAGFIVGSLLTPLLVRRARPAFVMAAGPGPAPTTTLATDLMVGTAPPERAGAASGISETGSEFGGALGIAILVAVLLRHVGAGPQPEWQPDPSPHGPCAGKVGAVKASGHAAGARAKA